ncbi:MAG: hypothetical protein M1834_000386 [Cirrosporium novae-zelandiae]|nr:MAG: hypothetical protein M1834_000386 [Cirrosporium novae-zelandiae]
MMDSFHPDSPSLQPIKSAKLRDITFKDVIDFSKSTFQSATGFASRNGIDGIWSITAVSFAGIILSSVIIEVLVWVRRALGVLVVSSVVPIAWNWWTSQTSIKVRSNRLQRSELHRAEFPKSELQRTEFPKSEFLKNEFLKSELQRPELKRTELKWIDLNR